MMTKYYYLAGVFHIFPRPKTPWFLMLSTKIDVWLGGGNPKQCIVFCIYHNCQTHPIPSECFLTPFNLLIDSCSQLSCLGASHLKGGPRIRRVRMCVCTMRTAMLVTMVLAYLSLPSWPPSGSLLASTSLSRCPLSRPGRDM